MAEEWENAGSSVSGDGEKNSVHATRVRGNDNWLEDVTRRGYRLRQPAYDIDQSVSLDELVYRLTLIIIACSTLFNGRRRRWRSNGAQQQPTITIIQRESYGERASERYENRAESELIVCRSLSMALRHRADARNAVNLIRIVPRTELSYHLLNWSNFSQMFVVRPTCHTITRLVGRVVSLSADFIFARLTHCRVYQSTFPANLFLFCADKHREFNRFSRSCPFVYGIYSARRFTHG